MGQLLGITLPPIGPKQVYAQNVAQELVERALDLKYPTLLVYCEKISNDLREKFRTFSGKGGDGDRGPGFAGPDRRAGESAPGYVDAVTRILDQNRGDWGNGMFYTGGYQAVFGQMEHGGRNFIQTGKISFEVAVSID